MGGSVRKWACTHALIIVQNAELGSNILRHMLNFSNRSREASIHFSFVCPQSVKAEIDAEI